MIAPKCFKCGSELTAFGALIFSPPEVVFSTRMEKVVKFHICQKCYHHLFEWLSTPPTD